MKATDLATFEPAPSSEEHAARPAEPASLKSPFAQSELRPVEAEVRPEPAFASASPFSESFATDDSAAIDTAVAEGLLAELEDEEFTHALESVAAEAAARYMRGPTGWNHEAGIPVLDPSDADAWMEAIGDEADRILAELEERFLDRPVETVTDQELDELLGTGLTELESLTDPLDAQELFFGALKKKFKKVAKAAKNVVKKGISIASKVMPLGIIFKRLRPIIKPLLRRVLARAIGKLPRSLRGPALRLARKYGLRKESEFDSEFDLLAAEFDVTVAEAMSASESFEWETLETEIANELAETDEGPNVAAELDAARERLSKQLLEAEPASTLVEEIEQFVPAAILPIVRTGIKLVGRRRVVNFVAGLLAKLIAPVVGRQLARPLSVQIADKGLALLNLEAEASSGRLGTDAVVATVEETLAEVFTMPDELLENELYLEAAVQDAFHRAAARHFPPSFLKPGVADADGPGEHGVWVMMPRATAPLYRYKKYSNTVPVRVTRSMAGEVVFSDGETLEDRLTDAGESNWPVDVEFEVYELLPGAGVGNLAAFESDPTDSATDAALELDTFEDAGAIPLPVGTRHPARGGGRQRLVRASARRKSLRRLSPVAVRLDLSGAQPTLRLHVFVSERRAMAMATDVTQQRHREVVAAIRSISNVPMRRVVAKRLGQILGRRNIIRDQAATDTLSAQLFDGLVGTLANQLPTIGGSLSSAAKDPARGLTITAAFPFTSTTAIGADQPGAPTITIRAGRHRD